MGIDRRDSATALTLDSVREKISDLDIFKYYCAPLMECGKKFKSELRKDPVPSAIVSFVKTRLRYIDFGYTEHSFDSIGYVQFKYKLTFMETLHVINNDFGLDLAGKASSPFTNHRQGVKSANLLPREKIQSVIQIRSRPFGSFDRTYWDQFQISLRTVEHFDVKAITHYWINGSRFQAHKIAYAYCEHHGRFKIYSPLKIEGKWYGNMKPSDIQGYSSLPPFGDRVFLTSSLKDVMCLFEFGIPAVAYQGEGILPSKKFIDHLVSRFEQVHVLYDNDFDKEENPGQRMANRIIEEYGLKNFVLPTELGCKDPSELVHLHGPIKLFNSIKT
jgi:hypothetical protein